MSGKSPRITLYTAPGCGHCRQLRDFLRRSRVPFQEWDIARNRRAEAEFRRLGARGVPVLTVGAERVDGFDPKRLRQVLRKAGFRVD